MPNLHLLEDTVFLSPRDVDTLVAGVVEVRAPALVQINGDILVACDARTVPIGDDWQRTGGAMASDLPNPNSLVLVRKSKPEVLRRGCHEPKMGFSDPSFITDGRRLALFHARSADVGFFGSAPWRSDTDRNTLHIDVALSDDGGLTWAFQSVTGSVAAGVSGAFATSGHGVCVDNVWLQPGVVRDLEGRTRHITWRSTDRGNTWHAGQPCGHDCDESTFERLGDVLVMSARSNSGFASGTLGRWWATSTDLGETWSEPVWCEEPAAAACNASLVRTPFGLALVYAQAGRVGGAVDVFDGDGWRRWAELGVGKHFGYADALWLNGQLYIIYESNGCLRRAVLEVSAGQ
ncbi:MAG: sialidase family protein [Corynebacterium sp.]|nr:sialidase family protein [Corynebacterium sp.]